VHSPNDNLSDPVLVALLIVVCVPERRRGMPAGPPPTSSLCPTTIFSPAKKVSTSTCRTLQVEQAGSAATVRTAGSIRPVGYQYDYHHQLADFHPSAQGPTRDSSASRVHEAGSRLFGIAGMGRTNPEPYWNWVSDPKTTPTGGGISRPARQYDVGVCDPG